MHWGTSVYYGFLEQAGILSCHHDWMYDVHGRCLDQPCEAVNGRRLDAFRQQWDPLLKRYGLAFAYLTPASEQPQLSSYDVRRLRLAQVEALKDLGSVHDGHVWTDRTEEERRLMPGESGAFLCQGTMTLHSDEDLVRRELFTVLRVRRDGDAHELRRVGGRADCQELSQDRARTVERAANSRAACPTKEDHRPHQMPAPETTCPIASWRFQSTAGRLHPLMVFWCLLCPRRQRLAAAARDAAPDGGR